MVAYRRQDNDRKVIFPSLSFADSFYNEDPLICQRECASGTQFSQGEIKYVIPEFKGLFIGYFNLRVFTGIDCILHSVDIMFGFKYKDPKNKKPNLLGRRNIYIYIYTHIYMYIYGLYWFGTFLLFPDCFCFTFVATQI